MKNKYKEETGKDASENSAEYIKWLEEQLELYTETILPKIEYRIEQQGNVNCFQPQYRTNKGKWKNFTHRWYDQRDGEGYDCNTTYPSLKKAQEHIDKDIENKTVKYYYKK